VNFGHWDLFVIWCFSSSLCALRHALVDGWERDDKLRSHIDLALHLNPSSLLLHNIFGDG
jgi:hypothetical protein